MKRELNSRSRRKWVAGGVLAFGSVALLSTGFATWVIGANKAYGEHEIGVTVDSVQNNSILVSSTISSSDVLRLAEPESITNGKIVNADVTDETKEDLKVTVSMTVKLGGNATAPTTVSASLPAKKYNTEIDSGNAKLSVSTDTVGGRSSSPWTYLELKNTTITPTWGTPTTEPGSNLKVYEVSFDVEFKWGSFFNNQSPLVFYNTKYSAETDPAVLLDAGDKIETELKAMATAFSTDPNIYLLLQVNQ